MMSIKLSNVSAAILVLLICTMLGTSCKKTERDGFLLGQQLPGHCVNGVQDLGELGVDCGPGCDPCPPVAAPCSPANNSFDFSGWSTTSASFVICSSSNPDYYKISADQSQKYIEIYLSGGMPTSDRTYSLTYGFTSPSSMSSAQAMIVISQYVGINFDYYYCSGGTLYANVGTGGEVTVTFCNVNFSGNNTASGLFVCD